MKSLKLALSKCATLFAVGLTVFGMLKDVRAQGCIAPPSGLTAWWRAEGDARDSAHANHGTLVNGTAFSTGRVGQSFHFDGINDYVGLPDNIFPQPSSGAGNTPFSFEIWFRTASAGVILGQQNTAPTATPSVFVPAIYVGTNGKLHSQLFDKGSIDPIISTAVVNDNAWHHVTIVYNGTAETVYLDGATVGSKTFTQQSNTAVLKYQLGAGYSSGLWPASNSGWISFKGDLDEASLYNRALTAQEASALYSSSAGKCAPVVTPQPPVVAPSDGKRKIVFTSTRDGNNEIYLMDEDGSNVRRLTTNDANDWKPQISPDGNKIAWSTNRDGGGHEIYEMNIDGSAPTRLTFDGSDDLIPVYSPDGNQIAFSANRQGDYDVYIMNRDGSEPRRVTTNPYGDYGVSFSPDGSEIAFHTYYGNYYVPQVTKARLDGSGQQQLTTEGDNYNGSWSRQNKISYTSVQNGNAEVYSMLPDGTGKVNLTSNAAYDGGPSWSPDGSRFAFASDRDGNLEIYAAAANGSSPVRLTNSPGSDDGAFWGPATNTPLPPSLKVTDFFVTEGNSGTTLAKFTVSLSAPTATAVTVDYTTAGSGTATATSDFQPVSGTLTFQPGEVSKVVEVTVNSDTLDEPNEYFTFNLSNSAGASLGDAQGTATIEDDDATPTLSIANQTINEGSSGATPMSFAVTLSAASGQQVMASYSIVNGTTTSSDFIYPGGSGTVIFAPGETSKNIVISVNGETTFENDETFTVQLSSPVGATIPSYPVFNPANNHYYELVRDPAATWDAARTAAGNRSVGGVSGHLATVTSAAEQTFLTQFPNILYFLGAYQPVGSAEPGGGWSWITGEPFVYTNWNTGEPNDNLGGAAENIMLTANGHRWNDATATSLGGAYMVEYDTAAIVSSIPVTGGRGTIVNDDTPPIVSVADVTVDPEGQSGSQTATFTVQLSAASSFTTTVDVQTADETASAGSDYTAQPKITLSFASGVVSKTVAVPVLGDVLDEDNETFRLELSNAVGGSFVDASGSATIVDDDATPTLSIDDIVVDEADTGVTYATFTVTLSTVSGRPVSFGFRTLDGSGHEPADYTSVSGRQTIDPGQVTRQIAVPIVNDDMAEDNVTFYGVLSSPTNATIAKSLGTAFIIDEDSPSVLVTGASVAEGNTGKTPLPFRITLSHATNRTVQVHYKTAGGTATSGTDYEAAEGDVSFAPSEVSKTVAINVIGDTVSETSETFQLVLSAVVNAKLANAQAAGTIVNDDNTGDLTPPPAPVIIRPATGSAIRTLVEISGTAVDNPVSPGLDFVRITLKRNADSKYWNGTEWAGTVAVELDTSLIGANWARSTGLPSTTASEVSRKLTDGDYTATAISFDRGGNRTSATSQFKVDTISPTVTITIPAVGAASKTFTLISGKVIDNTGGSGNDRVDVYLRRSVNGVTQYWGLRSGSYGWDTSAATLRAAISGTNWIISNGTPAGTALPSGADLTDTTYLISAYGYDRAGNISAASNASIIIDRTPPALTTVVTPGDGAVVQSLTGIVGKALDNPGGSGIARVQCYLRRLRADGVLEYWGLRNGSYGWGATIYMTAVVNGTNWGILNGSPAGVVLPSGAALTSGVYTVGAFADDRADNSGPLGKSTFTVDTVNPASVAVLTPANGATVQSLTVISGTASDNAGGSGIGTVNVCLRRSGIGGALEYWGLRNGSYSWNTAIAYLPAVVSGTNWSVRNSDSGPPVLPAGSALTNGSYTVFAYAYDRAGNITASLRNNFTVAASSTAREGTGSATTAPIPKSTVMLSAMMADGAKDTVTLTFTGAISAGSALRDTSYAVRINGTIAVVESMSSVSTSTVKLQLPEGELNAGDTMAVDYDLTDTRGRSVTGTSKVTAK